MKKSIKGGASSHLRPCQLSYSDMHNERLTERPSNENINPELSKYNTIIRDENVPNLVHLDRVIRKDYLMFNGRNLPSSGKTKASPLKESVMLLPSGDKSCDEMAKCFAKKIEQKFHIRCVRIYVHRDEYYNKNGTYNYHVHFVWDTYDHNIHKMIHFQKKDMRVWQDIAAEVTGMPRGRSAMETGKEGLTAIEYKCQQEEERLGKLKGECDKLDARLVQGKQFDRDYTKALKEKREEIVAKVNYIKQQNQEHEILCQKISESANMGPYAIVRKYEALRKRIFTLIKETINEDVQAITLEDDRFNVTANTGMHLFVGKLGVTYFIQGGQRIKHRSSDRMQRAFAEINKEDIIDLFGAYAPIKEVQNTVVKRNGMHL